MASMITSIPSMVAMAGTYCCTNAVGSICNSCLGTTLEGTTGRKRSVLLLVFCILASLFFQYKLGPAVVSESSWIWKMYSTIPSFGRVVNKGWKNACLEYEGQPEVMAQCAGVGGVYRPTFLATFFFFFHAGATRLVPALQKEVWPAKYTVYFFALLLSVFFPTDPLFGGFYLFIARCGAALFIILQQLILIDVAYNWNEDWVERANEADRLVYGDGVRWLQAIVASCVSFYVVCLVAIVHLYNAFGDCASNVWIITLTLLGVCAMTGIQLAGSEGSLLTSSIMSLYAVYLAFMMVSKNPHGECNPLLGENNSWGITIGLLLTTVSLAWTGWSWSAEDRLNLENAQSAKAVGSHNPNVNAADGSLNLDVPFLDPNQAPTQGIVTTTASGSDDELSEIWKLNIVLALISCWVAMTLTGWGIIDAVDAESHNAANPTASRVNMAIIGISQWMAICLYIWTLVAPRLFPDRDFS
ncbi:Serine incorporator 1 [Seminavis robusta]|uniref:Serine incorporator 1 n=1 Tax=Seminavis robusta TaxID=568900 RepID=A0A9N8E190_9STRA|nr:Serine incorporator 1 [Seminavis robusta]|eukprot:Sro549_g164560.1 Serine incorporator 1 (471) ;mRNA; r:35796-37809